MMKEAIEEFLHESRVALIGASHQPAHFSRVVWTELSNRGMEVVPVNATVDQIDDHLVVDSIRDVVPPVRAALVMVPGTHADAVVADCIKSGVELVWLFNGPGGKSDPDAVRIAKGAGLTVIHGQCPMMFIRDTNWVHRLHAVGKRLAGTYPAAEA